MQACLLRLLGGMNIKKTTALAAMAGLFACGGNQAVQLNEASEVPTTRWHATMNTPPTLAGAVQMTGTAWMAEAQDTTTRVQISLENAAPGGHHPWMVQRGRCGADRGLFGDASSYEPLAVDDDGTASASAIVRERVPTSGTYSVAVLASPSNQDLVVACGNLAPPVAVPQ